jgi:DNA segregation ATPase FtsK/SpoIIIE, S-DNA-T family
MARASNKTAPKGKGEGRRAQAPASSRGGGSKKPEPDRDSGTRREILGIVIGAVAVALAIALLTGERAVVPNAVAMALRALFGWGAFFVPVAALAWSATFFMGGRGNQEGRVGAGLLIAFLALIAIFALAPFGRAPASTAMQRGGWIGGAIAWALSSVLGTWIPFVIAFAALLAGVVLAGVSITAIVEGLRDRLAARAAASADGAGSPAEPRGRRRPDMTLPLVGVEEGGPTAGNGDTPAGSGKGGRGRKQGEVDPEAARLTVPAAPAVAPKAMEGFELPPLKLLTHSPVGSAAHKTNESELRELGGIIVNTLATFDIPAEVVGWTPGPTVTLFRVKIAPGVKVNRVTALADDLALSLAAPTIRILAPIPGESLIGVEVPNERRSTVTLGDVLSTGRLADPSPLLLAIGKDVAGESVITDLAQMPHLLIAGSTGTGKSVCINTLLTSILMRATPSEVRLILIDPKRIELASYNGLPHLYVPVVTETKQAASALAWAVAEMDSRLKRLQKAGARNIGQYNSQILSGKAAQDAEPMPYLVIVIDELADLMMVAAREVEDSIVRLAQLARAAGIHLIVATQRPSTDIITGLIKTNITNRIAFAVGSGIDSRVILDQPGAERLVGKGDMLYSRPEWPKPKRIQGAFVSQEETEAVVTHLKNQAEPDYHEEILTVRVTGQGGAGPDEDDPMLWEAADIVVISGLGSTSMLQRRLAVGYARAGRIMDMLEAKGVVGAPNGSKPRDVLVDVEGLESLKAFERQEADAS